MQQLVMVKNLWMVVNWTKKAGSFRVIAGIHKERNPYSEIYHGYQALLASFQCMNLPFWCLIFLWAIVGFLFSYSKLHGFHLLPLFLSSVSLWNTNWCKPKRCENFLTRLPFNSLNIDSYVTWHLKKLLVSFFFFKCHSKTK